MHVAVQIRTIAKLKDAAKLSVAIFQLSSQKCIKTVAVDTLLINKDKDAARTNLLIWNLMIAAMVISKMLAYSLVVDANSPIGQNGVPVELLSVGDFKSGNEVGKSKRV